MGDTLQAPAGTTVRVSVHVVGCQSARIVLLGQGASAPLADALLTKDDETSAFELRADGSRRWLRVDVRAPDGVPLLIGNPFYLNHSPTRAP